MAMFGYLRLERPQHLLQVALEGAHILLERRRAALCLAKEIMLPKHNNIRPRALV